MRSTSLPAVALALSVLLAACGDDPSGPDQGEPDLSSSMSFSYSGFHSGSFSVDAEIDPEGSSTPVDAAVAAYGSEGADSALLILGVDVEGGSGDLAIFSFYGKPTTGTYSLDFVPCAEQAQSEAELVQCPLSGFEFGLPLSGSAESEHGYQIQSGEIVLSQLTDTRVRGTFWANLLVEDAETGEVVGEVSVEDGAFDVPILDITDVGIESRIPLPGPRLQP